MPKWYGLRGLDVQQAVDQQAQAEHRLLQVLVLGLHQAHREEEVDVVDLVPHVPDPLLAHVPPTRQALRHEKTDHDPEKRRDVPRGALGTEGREEPGKQ